MNFSSAVSSLQRRVISPLDELWRQSEAQILRLSSFKPPIMHFDTVPPSPYLRTRHGIVPEVGFFETPDHRKLRFVVFHPLRKTEFTLLLVPGLNSPVEFHARYATHLARLGVLVIAFDLHSQGYSSRSAGLQVNDVNDFMDHVDDLDLIVNKLVPKYQKGKLVINAFSMGAMHTFLGLVHHKFEAAHSILVAPGIKLLELPYETRIASAVATLVRIACNTPRGYKPILPARSWDWSRSPSPPTDVWIQTNIYSSNAPQIRHIWKMAQLPGDMLRPGGPNIKWIHAAYENYARLREIPDQSVRGNITLILPEDDRVVCSRTAHGLLARTVADLPDDNVVSLKGARHAVELEHGPQLGKLAYLTTQAGSKNFPWRPRPASNDAPAIVG